MMQRMLFYFCALGSICFGLLGCGRSHPSYPGANLVIISIDTLRADRLPAYGGTVETPALDRLFADSVVFDKAFAQCPLTLPSHATMFTGLLPTSHGVRDNLSYRLNEESITLAEQLSERGYETGGFVSAMVLGSRTGIAQGFQTYDSDLIDSEGKQLSERPGSVALDNAKSWLAERGDSPFFLFIHFYEPHAPYEPPEPYNSRYENDYDGEIAYVDSLTGNLIAELKRRGMYENTVIMLVSDHGEGLGDHGELEHGVLLYREAIQVPLSVKLPGNALAGTRETKDVGLMDMMPAAQRILDLPETPSDGLSLFADQPSDRMIYSESYYPRNGFGYSPLRSLVRSPEHFIRATSDELYDWRNDPVEQDNLLPGKPLPGEYPQHLELLGEGLDERTASSSEDLELLASLGYTAVAGTPKNNASRDIRELVADLAKLKYAKDLVDRGEYGVGEGIYRELLERNPCLHEVRLRLGEILRLYGANEELETLYDDGLSCDPRNVAFLMLAIHHKIGLGKIDEAMTLTQFAWEVAPIIHLDEVSFFFYSGGETEKGVNLANNVLAKQADLGFSDLVLGLQENSGGQSESALTRFERAADYFATVQNAPMRSMALTEAAKLHQSAGRNQAAEERYRTSLEIVPNNSSTRQALARFLGSLGRQRDAIMVMDSWVRDYPSKKNYKIASETMQQLGIQDAARFYAEQSAQYD